MAQVSSDSADTLVGQTNSRPILPLMPIVPLLSLTGVLPVPTLGSIAQINETVFSTMMALNIEWLRLMAERIQIEIALSEKLTTCKTPDEFRQVLSDFIQVSSNAYSEGFAQLTRMSIDASGSVAKTLRQSIEESMSREAAGDRPVH